MLYVLSGVFLFVFDGATKLNYIDGFKKRSQQCSYIIIFIVVYGFLTIMTFLSSMRINALYCDSLAQLLITFFVTILPYFVPLMIFVLMLSMYALPHWASKKHFLNSEASLYEYLSVNETFYTFSDDNYVLASAKALFFPELLCVV